MTATVNLSIEALDALVFKALIMLGLSTPQARATTRVIVAGQRDACQSHGLYRVLTAAATLRDPQLAPSAAPAVLQSAPSVVSVDARLFDEQVASDLAGQRGEAVSRIDADD